MVFSWFKNLKKGLTKSSNKIGDGIKTILKSKKINLREISYINIIINRYFYFTILLLFQNENEF